MGALLLMQGTHMVNISVHNNKNQTQKNFFETPVLIKTLYYPSFSKDTLNTKPILRNYYMVSVYDEDTNQDGFINIHDLRRFYHFNSEGVNKHPLVPVNYSVISSEYDPANDFMYVFARIDSNENGKAEDMEDIHVFWINLSNPLNNGLLY